MTGWPQLTACQQLFTHILLSCQSFDLVGLFTASLGSHLGKVTQPLGQLCLWQCNAFFLKFFCNPVRGERRDRPERCTVDNEFLGCHNQTQCVSGCFIVTSSGVLTIFHIDQAQVGLRPAKPSRWDLGARIQFKRVHFGVLLTSPFMPSAPIYSHGWCQFEVVKIFCQPRGSQLTFSRK